MHHNWYSILIFVLNIDTVFVIVAFIAAVVVVAIMFAVDTVYVHL